MEHQKAEFIKALPSISKPYPAKEDQEFLTNLENRRRMLTNKSLPASKDF